MSQPQLLPRLHFAKYRVVVMATHYLDLYHSVEARLRVLKNKYGVGCRRRTRIQKTFVIAVLKINATPAAGRFYPGNTAGLKFWPGLAGNG
jgi:hypothetical protein